MISSSSLPFIALLKIAQYDKKGDAAVVSAYDCNTEEPKSIEIGVF
jgi:hypothetical protein